MEDGGMRTLAIDLETSAELLGVSREALEQSLKEQQLKGLRIGQEWRVSMFELSRLLDTQPDELLDYLEDLALADRIDETEHDELFEAVAGRAAYQEELRGRSS